MQEQYYIDWINSLDIEDSIFINTTEDLYKGVNNILLNIIAIILNQNLEEINNQFQNLNYLNKIAIIMKNNFYYNYETSDKINLKNNTILLIKFLKSKFPDNYKEDPQIKNNKFDYLSKKINCKDKSQTIERPESHKTLKKIQNINNNSNHFKNENNKNNDSLIIANEKKEEFILNYLYKIGIINIEQKNREYLLNKLIPDLKDGYIIGKLIYLLDNKSKNIIKGISNETFFKLNIYLNWKKIKQFLMTKEYFNSSYLYERNFFQKNNNILKLLYDICHYYYIKKDVRNTQIFCKRSKSVNRINKKIQNKINKDIQLIKDTIKGNEISSKEEIMKIREDINFINKNNKSKKDINKSDKNLNINKTEINYMDKRKIKNKLTDKINTILSFLSSIGIDTTQINFYSKEMKIFKDGILLHQIISQLEPNKNIIPNIDLNPKQAPNSINNHRLIINYLIQYKKNFSIKYIDKEKELYKAEPIFILNFLFEIKKVFKNEIYFLQKVNNRNMINKIYPKNIDKSERLFVPLDNKLRNEFIVQDFNKIWS